MRRPYGAARLCLLGMPGGAFTKLGWHLLGMGRNGRPYPMAGMFNGMQ